jgi:hypothetical protein
LNIIKQLHVIKVCAFQVLGFLLLTKEAAREANATEFRELDSEEVVEKRPVNREEQQQEYDDVVKEMLQV